MLLLSLFCPRSRGGPTARASHRAPHRVGLSIGFHEQPRWGSDEATIARCTELGIRVQAYSPSGAFTAVSGVLDDPTVVAIATAHHVHPMVIALRWLMQRGISAITATSSPAHMLTDIRAYELALSAEEMDRLGAVDEMCATTIGNNHCVPK